MANREIVNSILKTYLLESALPKIFSHYNTKLVHHSAYAVIIGGVSVEMCAKLDHNAQTFLKNVFSEDIDIKIVLDDKKIDTDIEAIHDIRMQFIEHICKKLNRFIILHKNEWDPTIQITISIDDSLLNHYIEHVRVSRVLSIAVDYGEGKYKVRYSLLDTMLFSDKLPQYGMYRKLIKKETIPVPYYTKQGVNYATCEYMMYDNCRMLVGRAEYLKEKKSLFALMKFTKYVIKFMALYVIRKKVTKLPPQLNAIYEDSYKVLQSINTFKLRHGFKTMYKVKYDEDYVDATVAKLEILLKASNLKGLIKIFQN